MISGGGSDGNRDFLFMLGTKASREAKRSRRYWALEQRRPDADLWVEVGRYPSEEAADEALAARTADDRGSAGSFRVRAHTRR